MWIGQHAITYGKQPSKLSYKTGGFYKGWMFLQVVQGRMTTSEDCFIEVRCWTRLNFRATNHKKISAIPQRPHQSLRRGNRGDLLSLAGFVEVSLIVNPLFLANKSFLGRKLKCDGARPSCSNCDSRKNVCAYGPVGRKLKCDGARPWSATLRVDLQQTTFMASGNCTFCLMIGPPITQSL